jgi:hypothetical protein
MQLELAKEVVLHLEMARDCSMLSGQKESLYQELKLKAPGLCSLRCMITR